MNIDSSLRYLFLTLILVFALAYPIAVIGVAFNVQPPFTLAWAASALLFLEGILLIISAWLLYSGRRALLAGLTVILISCTVETIGVNTGFPFGTYRYTNLLVPQLPGSVPLPVMFAWVLIIFGSYSWIRPRSHASYRRLLSLASFAALLATLQDLAIEPVAAHVERYWTWLTPGPLHYYGVPLINFLAWFLLAFVLVTIVARILGEPHLQTPSSHNSPHSKLPILISKLAQLAPRLIFAASLLMFGLVDLTHGYYWATLFAIVSGVLLLLSSAKLW